MPYQNMLFVEGVDDQHAIFHLLDKLDITATISHDSQIELVPDSIAVKAMGGYSALRKNINSEIKFESELLRAGIVIDGDYTPSRRWDSIANVLSLLGCNPPASMQRAGWTDAVSLVDREVQVGVWVFPNNARRGALEEFATTMIPTEDELWPYAIECLDNLPEQRFKSRHSQKARIHTWLAWQATPRLAIGQALARNLFQIGGSPADDFVAWIRRLFGLV